MNFFIAIGNYGELKAGWRRDSNPTLTLLQCTECVQSKWSRFGKDQYFLNVGEYKGSNFWPYITTSLTCQTLYLPAGGRKEHGNRAYNSFPSSASWETIMNYISIIT